MFVFLFLFLLSSIFFAELALSLPLAPSLSRNPKKLNLMHKPKMGPHPSPRNPIFSSSIFLTLYPFLALILAFSPTAAADPSSIYDNLRLYGLPIGLFPKGITQFSIDSTTGNFQFFLDQPCNAKFENQVHYDFNVSGRLSSGKIGELSGVSAQELFLWFPVKGIRVDLPSSGLIYFDVGVVDKQFSLSLFEFPPDCAAVDPVDPTEGDGKDSGNGSESEIKLKTQNPEHESGRRSSRKAAS